MIRNALGAWLRRAVTGGTVAMLSLALAACGGGSGAGAQGGSGNAADGSAPATLLLVSSLASLTTDGTQGATITAIVRDASNAVMKNQQVTISSSDTQSVLTPTASPLMTDSSGKATATIQLLGTSLAAKANRNIVITAGVGSVTQTLTLPVAGTLLSVDGSATMTQGASSAFTATVKDGGGNPIAGAPVAVTSALGNSVTMTQGTTDASGIAKFSVLAGNAGDDTLTASVGTLAVSGVKTVRVTGAAAVTGLGFTPASVNTPVNTDSAPITVTYVVNSVPTANTPLTLALTRGVFVGCTVTPSQSCTTANVVTNASGTATVTVRSATAGNSTLTGFVQADPTITANADLSFASGAANAAKITLSSEPSSVGINAPGVTANNRSAIRAVVRDATDNPVKGATVVFTANADPSGGSLSPATAVTDVNGEATSTFTPGGSSTGPNAVVIKGAIATNASLSATTSLTVNQVALFIDLGTGNEISAKDSTNYQMPWSAIVTDASSAAVSNKTVTASMTAAYDGDATNPTLKYYYKGVWLWDGDSWGPAGIVGTFNPALNAYIGSGLGPPVPCLNEDVNHNNILDPGEDKNGNGKLDPGSPAAVSVAGPTGPDGVTTLTITYPKSFAYWVNVSLKATISTSGTESKALRTFLLPALANDVTSLTKAPPSVGATVLYGPASNNLGSFSKGPYGADPTRDSDGFCTSPN